jgi:hypothetical protein
LRAETKAKEQLKFVGTFANVLTHTNPHPHPPWSAANRIGLPAVFTKFSIKTLSTSSSKSSGARLKTRQTSRARQPQTDQVKPAFVRFEQKGDFEIRGEYKAFFVFESAVNLAFVEFNSIACAEVRKSKPHATRNT